MMDLEPVFKETPKPVHVFPGETIQLSCRVQADDEPDVTWYKGDQLLRPKRLDPRISIGWDVATDQYSLVITNSKEDDSGKYTVKAENELGESTYTVEVLVGERKKLHPPQIETFPEPEKITVGEALQLECHISGNPTPQVKWFMDGEPIEEKISNTRITIDGDDTQGIYSIMVDEAEVDDSGEYTVTAVNEYGKIFHAVAVTVIPKVLPKRGKPPQFEEIPPEFTEKPKSVSVLEFEPVKIIAKITGKPDPTVTWFKGGKLLKSDHCVQLSAENGTHTMYIPRSTLLDVGEYTVAANNIAGGSFCTVSVQVEAYTESEASTSTDQEYSVGNSTDADLVIIEKLSPQILAEMEKIRSGDEDTMLFKEYNIRENYLDPHRGVGLQKGEIVEVLDTEKGSEWLVRKQMDRKKICYVPVKLLQGKGEAELTELLQVKDTSPQCLQPDYPKSPSPIRQRGKLSRSPSKRSTEGELSSEDEEADLLSEVISVYVAVADYSPPENVVEGLKLKEGQFVDVLDSNNPNRWLVKTKPTKLHPAKQGWVPPGYLDQKRGMGQLDRRSTREVFREDIIQITNKEQEALVKRRYALTDLLETEREYLIDMKQVMDRYFPQFQREDLPDELKDQKEYIFSTFEDIYNFHNGYFLSGLMRCTGLPSTVGEVFVKYKNDFQLYVDFLTDREQVHELLNQQVPKKFIEWVRRQPLSRPASGEVELDVNKQYEKEKGATRMSLIDYLERPMERINRYIQLLRDFIRYSARAGEDCTFLEEAVQMLIDLPRQAADRICVRRIEGYPGDITKMGTLHRHDDLQVWDKDSSRSRDRHAFLFDDKIILTKKKKAENPNDPPVFLHRSVIDLQDIQLNEIIMDERSFEMWYAEPTSEKLTVQCRNAYARQAWCTDVRNNMKFLGIEETDIPMEDTQSKKEPPPIPPKPIKKKFSEGLSEHPGLGEFPELANFRRSQDDSDSESRATFDSYETADSYESDLSSYYSAHEFDDGTSKPGFKRKIRPIMVKEDEPARFEAEICGTPAPTVWWLWNNEPILDTSLFKFETGSQCCALVIDEAKTGMGGRFTVRLENKNGIRECSANLIVEKKDGVAPGFKTKLAPQTINAGDSLRMEIEVTGDPAPSIVWLKDSERIETTSVYKFLAGENKSVLVIDKADATMNGVYTVKLSNEFGFAETSATLIVQEVGESPKFTVKLKPLNIKAGETAQLEVEVTGDPTPEISWYKDGEPITDTSKYQFMAGANKSCLVINKADTEVEGTYSVKISNSFGSSESSATVVVHEAGTAPRFTSKMTPVEVEEEDAINLQVDFISDVPCTVTWSKDGDVIGEDFPCKVVTSETNSTLLVKKATSGHEGMYSIKVSNEVGTVENNVEVTVEEATGEAPTFSSKLKPVKASAGDNVKLKVEICGDPAPQVTWYHEGLELDVKDPYSVSTTSESSTLIIQGVTSEMTGTYSVKLSNKYGSSENSVDVVVQKGGAAPQFSGKLKPVTVQEGEEILLTVEISGDPTPSVTWFKDAEEINKSNGVKITELENKATLHVRDAKLDMTGTYTVKLTNDHGSAESSVDVIVNKAGLAPKITSGLKAVKVKEGEPFELVVEASGMPSPTISWFKDGSQIIDTSVFKFLAGQGKSVLTVDQAHVNMTGTFSVKVTNEAGEVEDMVQVTVQKGGEAPSFTSKLQTLTVTEGDSCKLEVKVTGDPVPTVTWFKANQQIQDTSVFKFLAGGNKVSLVIDEASMEMAGNYKVQIFNELGSEELSTSIIVEKAGETPKFKSKLQPLTITEGDSCKLELKVTGDPVPTVTWFKDNAQIKDTSIYKFLAGGSKVALVIDEATLEMTGTYKVKITNDLGSDELTTTIKVDKAGEAPAFKSNLKPITVSEGESCKLEVKVIGDPIPTVTWFKDNTQITDTSVYRFLAGGNKVALVIDEATMDMAGTYKIKISNDLGFDELTTTIKVDKAGEAPRFTSKCKPLTVTEGDSCKLGVKVTGDPVPTVTWFKDNQQIKDTSVYKFLAGGNKVALIIDEATMEMTGTYKVKISNDLGSEEMSTTVNVEKAGEPPSFTSKLKPLSVTEGDFCKLEVKVLGDPVPMVTWYKDSQQIQDTSVYKFLAGGNKVALVIDEATMEMSGKYTVKIANELGSEKLSTEINVEEAGKAPTFTSNLQPISVAVGDAFSIDVEVSGNPFPEVIWLKDKKEIVDTSQYKFIAGNKRCSLLVDKAELDMSGVYVIKISNDHGTAETSVMLQVVKGGEAPEFISRPRPIVVKEGDKCQLQVSLSGDPAPSIHWYKDNKKIIDTSIYKFLAGAGTSALVIDKAELSMAGTFKVKAVNPFGSTECTFDVKVEKVGEPPELKTRLKALTVKEGEKCQLEVELSGFPMPEVKWYKDNVQIQDTSVYRFLAGGGKCALVIEKAEVSMSGTYKVKAINDFGSADCRAALTVEDVSSRPEIEDELRPISVEEGQAAMLECRISGKPSPEITWHKDGKQIFQVERVKFLQRGDVYTLSILNTMPSDSGTYKVKAKNKKGYTSSRNILNIRDIPKKKEEKEQTNKQKKAAVIEEGDDLDTKKDDKEKGDKDSQEAEKGDTTSTDEETPKPEDVKKPAKKTTGKDDVKDKGRKLKSKETDEKEGKKSKKKVKSDSSSEDDVVSRSNKKHKEKERNGNETLKKGIPKLQETVIITVEDVDQGKLVDYEIDGTDEQIYVGDSMNVKAKEIPSETIEEAPSISVVKVKKRDDLDENDGKPTDNVKINGVKIVKTPVDADQNTDKEKKKHHKKENTKTPKFLSHLEAQNVVEGSEVNFACKLSSEGKPDIKWLLDGNTLRHNRNCKAKFDGEDCSLKLTDVVVADGGIYTCHVLIDGQSLETSAKLTVKTKEVPKPALSETFGNVEVTKRGEAKFSCKLSGDPTKVKWHLNGRPLTDTGRITMSKNGNVYTLTIKNVFGTDSGEILVKATNKGGETSHKAMLKVIDKPAKKIEHEYLGWPPKITKKMMNTEGLVGENVQFSIRAIGEPTPSPMWRKDGKSVRLEGRYSESIRGNVFTLNINNLEQSDAGQYSVDLTNTAGKDTSAATLTVEVPVSEQQPMKAAGARTVKKQPPEMSLERPHITEETEGGFLLTWKPATGSSGGSPVGTVEYVVEKKELPSGSWMALKSGIDGTSCRVSGLQDKSDYLFRVKAENIYGLSDPTSTVSYSVKADEKSTKKKTEEEDPNRFKSKLAPRSSIEKPEVTEITDNSLKISWFAAEIPSYGVQTDIYYTVESRCPPNRTWTQMVTDLKTTNFVKSDYDPDKEYMFRVRAVNQYGRGDVSLAVNVVPKKVISNDLKPKENLEGDKRKEREKRMEDFEADLKLKQKKAEDQKPKVKPRSVWDRPEVLNLTDNSFQLKWKASSIPSYAKQTPITYTIETRQPPCLDWSDYTTGLEATSLYVKNFDRAKDSYFRVKAVNEFGESEPSMSSLVKRLDAEQRDLPKSSRRGKSSQEYDDLMVRKIPKHLAIHPEFTGKIDTVQYGVEGQPLKIVTHIRAVPAPKITWYLRGEKVEYGGHFNSTLALSGQLALEIDSFTLPDVGEYKISVQNELGSVSQTIQVSMADPPTFLEPLKDQVIHIRKDGRLECRIHGIPYPDVKFKHDWRTVPSSHRVQIKRESHDHWSLNINGAIRLDEGVYECVVENVAGKVHCSCKVKIADKSDYRREVKFRPVSVENHFHIIEEIGRGSYGVVRRVIDKNFGGQYAAKFLRFGDDETRKELKLELETLSLLDHQNIVQVVDAYEDRRRFIIVMEMLTGGELFQRIIREDCLTESEVAFYIRQMLRALEYMHAQNVIHLDIKPENIFLSEQWSDEVKLIDFGYARRYSPRHELKVKYGTPEFVAPEALLDQPVTPAADMWSAGAVTHLLLTGISPFFADTERETLKQVRDGNWQIDKHDFCQVSEEGKDFLQKLLLKNPKQRMSASDALDHDWMKLADHRGLGQQINVDNLKAYCNRRKWQREISSVKTVVRPRPFSSYMMDTEGATDLSALVSAPEGPPPAELFSKKESTENGVSTLAEVMGPPSATSVASTLGSVSSSEWAREYEDEDTWYEWTSSRDRSTRSFTRERRDVRDIATEDDIEKIKSPKTTRRSLQQLKGYVASAGREEGFPPIFKEKIHDKAYNVGENCTLKVHVVGSPPPAVSWYRNDELLTDGYEGQYGRIRTSQTSEGRFTFTILNTTHNDFGVFKCVARNKYGKVTCRARMLLGSEPTRPGRPHVTKISDTEAYMIWEEPESDGNCYITGYRVDWLKHGQERWTIATYTIDECALIKGLQPGWIYRFRISAINQFGSSPYSWASVEIRTKNKGCAAIDIDETTKKILLRSRQATRQPSPERSPASSRRSSLEDEEDEFLPHKKTDKAVAQLERDVMLKVNTDPGMFWEFNSEIWRGRFAIIRGLKSKENGKERMCKVYQYHSENMEESLREYEMLKGVRQEHIVRMVEAFVYEGFVLLVQERLYGENVARSLSLKNKYNEHQVACITKQVLDGLQFLHHHGIVHLNIQPDNIIMVSRRRCDVKLIDFGRAHRITSSEGVRVPREGTAEFMAPEKVLEEDVGVAADVWGVGVLAFILLSGSSPFRADTETYTFRNITSVRYDAHELYHNITRHAMKFIYYTLRKDPQSRLTTEECLEHRWITPNHQLVKTRKSTVFPTEKLRKFEENYIARRMSGSNTPVELIQAYGSKSTSDQHETF